MQHYLPFMNMDVVYDNQRLRGEFTDLHLPTEDEVEAYLRGMSYVAWSNTEMEDGRAMAWHLANRDLTSY